MPEILNDFLAQQHPAYLAISFLLLAVLACVPLLPTPLVISIIAMQYDWQTAFIVSLSGNVVGSIVMYMLCQRIFFNRAQQWIVKKNNMQRFVRFIEKNGFLAVLVGRLIPLVPSAVMNALAGMMNISFWSFVIATTIGKLPNILVYALAGSELQQSPLSAMTLVGVYSIVIVALGRAIKQHI